MQHESDESDDVDRRNDRKIYNLTDILSTESNELYKERQRQQQKPFYLNNKLNYAPTTVASTKTSSSSPSSVKDRYYIYSHTKKVDNDAEMEINNRIYDEESGGEDDKRRQIRSSTLSDRKQISRNISLVLENLLMSYENSQLPTHGEGTVFYKQ